MRAFTQKATKRRNTLFNQAIIILQFKHEGFIQYSGKYTREIENTEDKERIKEKRRSKARYLRNHEK